MTATEFLSVADVARITGLSEWTVRQAVNDGELKAMRLRTRIRIHPDDLATWFDENRVRPVGSLVIGGFTSSQGPRSPVPDGGARAAVRAQRGRAA